MSTAGPLTRSVRRSTCPAGTSACCFTEPAPGCGPPWRDTSMAEHVTCQEVVELVTDYLERVLPAGETALFEQHLNFCDGCVFYVEQMRTAIDTVGRVREQDVPVEARARLLTAFREWKRA